MGTRQSTKSFESHTVEKAKKLKNDLQDHMHEYKAKQEQIREDMKNNIDKQEQEIKDKEDQIQKKKEIKDKEDQIQEEDAQPKETEAKMQQNTQKILGKVKVNRIFTSNDDTESDIDLRESKRDNSEKRLKISDGQQQVNQSIYRKSSQMGQDNDEIPWNKGYVKEDPLLDQLQNGKKMSISTKRWVVQAVEGHRIMKNTQPCPSEPNRAFQYEVLVRYEGYRRRQWQPMNLIEEDTEWALDEYMESKNLKAFSLWCGDKVYYRIDTAKQSKHERLISESRQSWSKSNVQKNQQKIRGNQNDRHIVQSQSNEIMVKDQRVHADNAKSTVVKKLEYDKGYSDRLNTRKRGKGRGKDLQNLPPYLQNFGLSKRQKFDPGSPAYNNKENKPNLHSSSLNSASSENASNAKRSTNLKNQSTSVPRQQAQEKDKKRVGFVERENGRSHSASSLFEENQDQPHQQPVGPVADKKESMSQQKDGNKQNVTIDLCNQFDPDQLEDALMTQQKTNKGQGSENYRNMQNELAEYSFDMMQEEKSKNMTSGANINKKLHQQPSINDLQRQTPVQKAKGFKGKLERGSLDELREMYENLSKQDWGLLSNKDKRNIKWRKEQLQRSIDIRLARIDSTTQITEKKVDQLIEDQRLAFKASNQIAQETHKCVHFLANLLIHKLEGQTPESVQ